jgi:hypothetical protein
MAPLRSEAVHTGTDGPAGPLTVPAVAGQRVAVTGRSLGSADLR